MDEVPELPKHVKQSIQKWGQRYHIDLREDMRQEAYLAILEGKDEIDAIRRHWSRWRMGKVPRKRWVNFTLPTMLEWMEDSVGDRDETTMEDIIAARRALRLLDGHLTSNGNGWKVMRRKVRGMFK